VPKNEPDQLKAALAQQPVSVAIEADKAMFHYYASGILDSPACGTSLDHGVLAVGYGKREDDGVEYYLVKNSWNTTWGDKGYFKLRIIDGAGTCGIQL
jgi:C1A family cysteine protease